MDVTPGLWLRARRVALLTVTAATGVLAACGGYGGGNGYGMGMGMGMGGAGMGCGGGPYGGTPCMPPTPPTVTMHAVGPAVNRTVTLSAGAIARSGATITQVSFTVDGGSVGTATTAPYSIAWDTTTVTDGSHTLSASALDSSGQTASAAAITVTVDNHPTFTVGLTPGQIFPAPTSSATASASLGAALGTGALSGKVAVTGLTASAVTLNAAFAGNTGPVLVSLTPSPGTAGEWDVPAGALLTAPQVTALMQGGLYVVAATAAHPAGEIRGQILPPGITVVFSAMDGSQEVPAVAIDASGVAASTVDANANTVTEHVHTAGVGDAMAAAVDNGAAGATGATLVTLVRDSADPQHWSSELAAISAADVANFQAGRWYVNVTTPADPNGAIRGQIAP